MNYTEKVSHSFHHSSDEVQGKNSEIRSQSVLLETDFVSSAHLQSCKLQAKTYRWKVETLKARLEQSYQLRLQRHAKAFRIKENTPTAV